MTQASSDVDILPVVTELPLPVVGRRRCRSGSAADERRGREYASWFACLAEPMRVRLLHAVAVAVRPVTVGELTEQLGISQSTCSHHVKVLADVGFVVARREGSHHLRAGQRRLLQRPPARRRRRHGPVAPRPCCPNDLPADVLVCPLAEGDWDDVRRIYAEGIATGDATFETEVPERGDLEAGWLPGHRWVAEVDGRVAGWACAKPTRPGRSTRGCGDLDLRRPGLPRPRRRKALIHQQVTAADADGLWTLQTSIFPRTGPA